MKAWMMGDGARNTTIGQANGKCEETGFLCLCT